MAKTPTSELFSTLRTYFNQLSEGERTPAEVATAFNGWAKESAESIKAKIAEEVEASVSKMGFIKREEYDLLLQRVSQLEKSSSPKGSNKGGTAEKSAKVSAKESAKASTRRPTKAPTKVSDSTAKKRAIKKASK